MFNRQPTLHAGPLTLAPLQETHRDALRVAASDPAIWAGHPSPDRYKPDVFAGYFDTLLGFQSTLLISHNNDTIGCSAYYTAAEQPGTIAIGYTFLTTNHWGGVTNRAVKTLMLDHAFKQFDAVWLHIGPDNIRSQTATQRLGAVYSHTSIINSGNGPAEMQSYRLDRSTWRDRIGQ